MLRATIVLSLLALAAIAAPLWLPTTLALATDATTAVLGASGIEHEVGTTTVWGIPLVHAAVPVIPTAPRALWAWLAIAIVTGVGAALASRPAAPVRYFVVLNAFLLVASCAREIIAGTPAPGALRYFAQAAQSEAITILLVPMLAAAVAAALPFSTLSLLALALGTLAAVVATTILRTVAVAVVVSLTGTVHLTAAYLLYGPPLTLFVVTSVYAWFVASLGHQLARDPGPARELWTWS